MKKTLVILLLATFLLQGCSKLGVLSLLTGGGPNVAANVQAGQTNSQTVGTTSNTTQKLIRPQAGTINQTADRNDVRADHVEKIVVYESNPWMWVALVIAIFLDSPMKIGSQILSIFKRRGPT